MKALLLQVKYSQDAKGYVIQSVEKAIRFPSSPKHIADFFKIGLPHLQYWKLAAEENLCLLRDGFNEDRSSFGSPRSQNHDCIKPTWLGPKTSGARTVPPPPSVNFD